jgi:hypothetical protein
LLLAAIAFTAMSASAQTTEPSLPPASAQCYDFGKGGTYPGWTGVADEPYTDARGYGWVGQPALKFNETGRPDDLRHDYATGTTKATFRVRVPRPGYYRVAIVAGDMWSPHSFSVTATSDGAAKIDLKTRTSQFVNGSMTIGVNLGGGGGGPGRTWIDITFDGNWVCNGLVVIPATGAQPPRIDKDFADPDKPAPPAWLDIAARPDPTADLVKSFESVASHDKSTPVDRTAYLKFIESDVDFWAKRQDANGAIIDPYIQAEWQYSTPCFAFAAAQLAVALKRDDLVEPAARALDWATVRLSQHKAATSHEDFYPPHIAHAMELLKAKVPAERYAKWSSALMSYDPYGGYEMAMGSMNWNVVALSGESMFHDLGLRDYTDYVEDSLSAQGHLWASDWGVYGEGPIPYDAWPRLFLSDMMAHGYAGPHHDAIAETLRRGAITGLFMQSPAGEMPTGARSSQHVWNEALQCALFEDAAANTKDPALAGAFKRGAALSFAAMHRWKRDTGELQIVHNWVDPQDKFGYEVYTALSQYNLMACTTLCSAYQRAGATWSAPATVAPAEVGGFVLDLRGPFHKVFANAGGTYVEIDTAGDGHYSPTGLLRVHQAGVTPSIGPSDGLVVHPNPVYPATAVTTTAGVGMAWRARDGAWRRLAEFQGDAVHTELTVREKAPGRVVFELCYTGDFGGPTAVVERYTLTPGRVEQATTVQGYGGPTRVVVPVLANDGREATHVDVAADRVTVRLGNSSERFSVDGGTAGLGPQLYAFRNGWAQLATFDVAGNAATLVVTPASR